jgi:hypothetical protein
VATVPARSTQVLVSSHWVSLPGGHTLHLTVDPNGTTIAPVSASIRFDVQALAVGKGAATGPELIASAVWAWPRDPVPGEVVTFLARIDNVGDAPTASLTGRFTVGTNVLPPIAIAPVASGASVVVSSPRWVAAEGAQPVTFALVDAVAAKPGKQQAQFLFPVRLALQPTYASAWPLLDLSVQWVSIAPNTFDAERIRFQAEACNVGKLLIESTLVDVVAAPAARPPLTLFHTTVGALPSGACRTISASAPVPADLTGTFDLFLHGNPLDFDDRTANNVDVRSHTINPIVVGGHIDLPPGVI